jgi:hypothetical protein
MLRTRTTVLGMLAIALLAMCVTSAGAWARAAESMRAIAAAEPDKAPRVTKQPVGPTVEEGQSASFSATASGVPAPAVQWERSLNGGGSWTAIEGATATTFTIAAATTAENANQFRATFKNAAGEATTRIVTLTVQKTPTITAQPSSVTVEEGQNAVFGATAAGLPVPAVKWETSANAGKTWTAVSGATSSQLTIAAAKTSLNGHEYRASFKNTVGEAISQAATLTVQKAPAIAQQPADLSVDEGQNAQFEAAASGFPAPGAQWEVSTDGGATWSPLEGATGANLTIPAVDSSQDGHLYRAVFHNAAGTVTSRAALLSVHAVPVVTQQPADMTVEVGDDATFEAAASGFPAPTVQWELSSDEGKTWTAIAQATGPQLTIAEAKAGDNGHRFRAVFTNTAGKTASAPATLTVATSHFSALAWGDNTFAQLGDGQPGGSSDVPVPVAGLKFVTAVAAGGRHSLALLADGTVVAWGANGLGQLGDGETEASAVPVAVRGLSGVSAISAGASHSLALLKNGTVMAWGDNESGQLGIASNAEDSLVPVAVQGLSTVRAISAGANFSLALLASGTVVAWGENESGQLGTGSVKPANSPVPVKRLTGVSGISAGGEFALALLSNGTVQAWGSNERGQLGNGSTEEIASNQPIPVPSLSGVTAVAAGTKHALALLSSGSLVAWGDDSAGELGNGAVEASRASPVPVGGVTGATAISAGRVDSAALLASGSVMTWGSNAAGVLGYGLPNGLSDVPVTVAGLSKAASVSVGRAHMLAFGEPIPTVTSVSPGLGPSTGGTTVTISGDTFDGASAVHFGAAQAASMTVDSATSITAVAPPGHGTVDVTVTTPAGTSPAAAADRYTYQLAPTVRKLSVKSGSAAGGTKVTLTGSELTGATSVSFGGVSAGEFTVTSATSIAVVAPPGISGTVDVTVTTAGGTSVHVNGDRFRYLPTVEAVSPNTGSPAGGVSVVVSGHGFVAGKGTTSFKFAKTKSKSVQCSSDTTCTVLVPAHPAGTVDVLASANKANGVANGPGDLFTYG